MYRALIVLGATFALWTGFAGCDLPTLEDPLYRPPGPDWKSVCIESYLTLKNLFRGLNMMESFVSDGIAIKPAKVPEESPCYGMGSTCCLASEEKGMERVVELEHHRTLQSVLENRLQSCNKLGRITERSIYHIISETRQILEAEISSITGIEVPKELFETFFQFLFRFIHVLDFCQLTNEIDSQMKKLYRFVVANMDDNSGFFSGQCAEGLEAHFINTWYNSSLSKMVETFNIIRLIAESYQLTESLLTDLKQHKFSPQCINALFRLRHCSYCTGNHYSITICDGHCINTFRGCMVDMYELKPHFKSLQQKLSGITKIAKAELSPTILIQTSMMEFIYLTKHLMKFNLKSSEMLDESCVVLDNSIVSQVEADRLLHNSQSQSQHPQQSRSNTLAEAIKMDSVCYEDIQSMLSELDEQMCSVSPNHIRYIRNKSCWNGTHSKGSYEHQLVGKTRSEQSDNPAFKRESTLLPNSYGKQISQIDRLIQEINQTTQFYECIETDDEDCQLFVLECKATLPLSQDDDFQSGSGSGSGISDVGNHMDTETNSHSILLRLGGRRQYDVMAKETGDRTKPNDNNDELPTSRNNNIIDSDNTSDLFTASNATDPRPVSSDNKTIIDEENIPQQPTNKPVDSTNEPVGSTDEPTDSTDEPSLHPKESPTRKSLKQGNAGSTVQSSIFILLCSISFSLYCMLYTHCHSSVGISASHR